MIFPINSSKGRIRVTLDLWAEKPCTLVIRADDMDNPRSQYINRQVNFTPEAIDQGQQRKQVNIPFPLTPDRMALSIYSPFGTGVNSRIENANVLDIRITPLEAKYIREVPDIHRFIDFASWFAQAAGFIAPGTYKSPDEHYTIDYLPVIRDLAGTPLVTPARTSRATGQIEASRTHFQQYSIPVRWFILLHERKHFQLPTREEKTADLSALKVFLDFGFPKIEAIYAATKAMDAHTDLAKRMKTQRLKDLHSYIDHYMSTNQHESVTRLAA